MTKERKELEERYNEFLKEMNITELAVLNKIVTYDSLLHQLVQAQEHLVSFRNTIKRLKKSMTAAVDAKNTIKKKEENQDGN